VSEFWQPARFNYQSGLDYDVHDPYTDSFNKWMVQRFLQESEELPEFMPEGKGSTEAQRLAHYFEDEQPWNQLLSDAMVKAGPRLKELETEAAAKRRAEQWRSLLSHFKCLPTKCLPGSS